MQVLFADAIDETALDSLREAGHEVELRAGLTHDELPGAIGEAEALVVRSTKVTEAAIMAATRLSLIVRAGAGVENIDMVAASNQGIHVCNVPGRNAVAVAELTMGLLLAVDRHIADATADLRAGVWNKKVYSNADGLMGRTLGVVGLGEIGLRVAERAKAFGLSVIGVRKPGRSPEAESRIRSIGIRLVDTLEALVADSDIVSLHVPANPATASMVDAALLDKFREGAILLNTSRGDCVVEADLLAAMDEKGLRVGLDVYQNEPGSGDHEFRSALAQHPNVVGTHHIGASTQQAQRSVARGVVDAVVAFAAGEPQNCLNLAPRGTGSYSVTIRHFDRVGVLASVLGVLRGAGLNVQHMENRVFEGGTAAVATIDVSGPVASATVEDLAAIRNVLGVSVTESAAP